MAFYTPMYSMSRIITVQERAIEAIFATGEHVHLTIKAL